MSLFRKSNENSKDLIYERLGIANIANGCIMRIDGKLISLARINPINIDLLSPKDEKILSQQLIGALNGIRYSFEIVKLDRIVDLQHIIDDLRSEKKEISISQKQARSILRNQATDVVASGKYTEPHFYTLVYGNDEVENRRNLSDLRERLRQAKIETFQVMDNEIIQLVNLSLNPINASYNVDGDYDYVNATPIAYTAEGEMI